MMKPAPHAYGVDDIARLFPPRQDTPLAWIMLHDFTAVPTPVLGVGHFKRALRGYSCRVPKLEEEQPTLFEM
jgi:hypothetical protein